MEGSRPVRWQCARRKKEGSRGRCQQCRRGICGAEPASSGREKVRGQQAERIAHLVCGGV